MTQVTKDYLLLCELLGEDPNEIKAVSRKLEIVSKRQIIQWVLFKHQYSKSEVALFFQQDHSTVINSIQKVEDHRPYYQEARDLYSMLNATLAK
jgi:chromosomal replication initiation ATPase DnaA